MRIWWLLGLPALVSCASYQTKIADFRNLVREGKAIEASDKIKEKAFADGDDQVVYLFEYATAQQIAGNYDESNKAFLKVEDLTEIKDYHSVSRIGGSLLLSQGMVQYKGEDFEKVLINGMLAINYLMLKNLDDAQVETRKLNDKLYKYRYEGKKNYQQNPFAFYLSALIWEANHNWDSAYIDYNKTYELNPNLEYLHEDLIRAAKAANRPEEAVKWQKKFPNIKPADLRRSGELILVFQQGWGPVKRPNPAFIRVPKLYPTSAITTRATLEIDQGPVERTEEVVDISDVAIKQLDEQYAGIIAMRAAGIATKAVVADQIRQKNELLGGLAWIGMNLADQADLRQWTSLPASIQIAKLRLAPGAYRARAVGLDAQGNPSGEVSPWQEVQLVAGKKTFMQWRSLK